MTSSSHWRIPTAGAQRIISPARDERTLWASVAQVGAWSRAAARSASHAAVAGLLVGGVLVAPVLALFALLGLFTSPLAMAHRIAPALIFVSLLWLAVAILGAHMQVDGTNKNHPAKPSDD